MASKRSAVVAQEMPAVVGADFDLVVRDDVEVVLVEERRGYLRDERFELCDDDALDGRVDADGAGRDTGAEADDEHGAGLLGKQRRQMTEHALQTHVLRVRRRLGLAGVVVRQRAARLLGHGDRRRDAFGDVNDVRIQTPSGEEPAVGDKLGRQRGDYESGRCERHGDRDGSRQLARRAAAVPDEQHNRCAGARDDHELLRSLAAEQCDEHERRQQRADDRAGRVRGVQPSDGAPRFLAVLHRGGERERKARAP